MACLTRLSLRTAAAKLMSLLFLCGDNTVSAWTCLAITFNLFYFLPMRQGLRIIYGGPYKPS